MISGKGKRAVLAFSFFLAGTFAGSALATELISFKPDPDLANEIVRYHEENGPFSQPADIINVQGVGVTKYRIFKDLIIVE